MAKTQQSLLSIIVISYNTAKLTIQCLESVVSDIAQSTMLAKSSEVIVVDNDSSDNSQAIIKDFIKKCAETVPIKLIQNKANLGFAQANNLALKQARGEYFLLLNSDTIVQTGALETLVKVLQTSPAQTKNKQLGLVAASLWNPDGSYQPQGGDQISLLSAACQWLMLDDLPIIGNYLPTLQRRQSPTNNPPAIQSMGWVGATAVCFPRQLYESVGGLDESIFMYAEDVEFCLRANQAGWKSAIAHQAKVTHLGSASSSISQAKIGEARGVLKIWPKYFGSFSTFFLKLIIYWGSMQRLVLFTLLGRSSQARTYQQLLRQL